MVLFSLGFEGWIGVFLGIEEWVGRRKRKKMKRKGIPGQGEGLKVWNLERSFGSENSLKFKRCSYYKMVFPMNFKSAGNNNDPISNGYSCLCKNVHLLVSWFIFTFKCAVTHCLFGTWTWIYKASLLAYIPSAVSGWPRVQPHFSRHMVFPWVYGGGQRTWAWFWGDKYCTATNCVTFDKFISLSLSFLIYKVWSIIIVILFTCCEA